MQYPVVISGAGILGCYISEALTLQGIDSVVLEKDIDEVEDSVRTITLNPFSKNLLDKIDIVNDYSTINKMEVKDYDGSGKIVFKGTEIGMDHLAYVIDFVTLLIYGLAAEKISVWLRSKPKILNTISACVLLIIAIYVAATQNF